jgi:hypothetical protein
MSKWQPIETAPQGEVILLAEYVPWQGWQYEVGVFNPYQTDSFFKPSRWKPIKPPEL